MTRATRTDLIVVMTCSILTCVAAVDCSVRCGNPDGDTVEIQQLLNDTKCSRVIFPAHVQCISSPLLIVNRSNFQILMDRTAKLKAGPDKWENISFITISNVRNFSWTGAISSTLEAPSQLQTAWNSTLPVIDASGELWWTGSNKAPGRPIFMHVINSDNVTLSNLTLLNPAAWCLVLNGGNEIQIDGLAIISPNYIIAPNTDGIDIGSSNVTIQNTFVSNGDDSICIKEGAHNVLVENCIVEQGNGLVVGTGSFTGANSVSNITFRNCTARGTLYGGHIKFKDSQTGSLSGVIFEDIIIDNAISAALEICQQGQNCIENPQANSTVHIENITFRNIRILNPWDMIGRFMCSSGSLACNNIVFDNVIGPDVSTQTDKAVLGGCVFQNVFGHSIGKVFPTSCIPPKNVHVQ